MAIGEGRQQVLFVTHERVQKAPKRSGKADGRIGDNKAETILAAEGNWLVIDFVVRHLHIASPKLPGAVSVRALKQDRKLKPSMAVLND